MAQMVNALHFRLGHKVLWPSQWYTRTAYASVFFEDIMLERYLRSLFEHRGILCSRVLIKRSLERTLVFVEIYGNPYFRYTVPRRLRTFCKLQRVLQFQEVRSFLERLSSTPISISVLNLFQYNRMQPTYLRRLRGQFWKYKNYRFATNILGVFNLVIRLKAAAFLARTIRNELQFLEQRKKNRLTWQFVSFLGKLVGSLEVQNQALHGMRLQITGRFRGMKRPKRVRFRSGIVPYNTVRAIIDYAYSTALSVNGSYGIKLWICYREEIL